MLFTFKSFFHYFSNIKNDRALFMILNVFFFLISFLIFIIKERIYLYARERHNIKSIRGLIYLRRLRRLRQIRTSLMF